MKKVLFAWVALIGLMCHQAQAQMIIDTWNMTTGVDTTLWYDIDGVDSVIIASGNIFSACSGVRNIGFDFTLGVSTYSQFSTNINGTVRLGSTPVPSSGGYSNALNQSNGPKIEPFGWRGRFDDNCYTRMALLGTAGNRVRVVETRMKDYTFNGDSLYVSFQVQLFETGGFRVVYGESDSGAVHSASSVRLQNGVSATVNNNNRDIIFFDFATHEAVRLNTTCSLHNAAESWPERGRWYMLAYDSTLCPYPSGVTASATDPANVSLQNPDGGTLHVVIPAKSIDTLWTGTSLNLGGGFNPATTYLGTIQTVCGSDTSLRARNFSFTTGCGPVVHLPWVSEFSNYSLNCWDASQYSYYNYRWKGSNGYAVASSLTSSGTNTHYDEWLVSPVVNLPNDDGLVMKFKYSSEALQGVSPTMDVRVAPCTAAGVVNTADWTTVMTLTGVYSNYIERRISLDTWRGQTVKVAFVRTGLGGNCVYLDRVELLQELEPVFTLTAPTHARTGESVTLTAHWVTGANTGLTYTWHSSLLDSTILTIDTIVLTYPAAGTDTVTLVVSNAYGADTLTVVYPVVDCTPATSLPWTEDFQDGDICWYKPEGSKWHDAIPNGMASQEHLRHLYLQARTDTLGSWIMSKEIQIPADTTLATRLFWNVASSNNTYQHLYSVLVTTAQDYTDTANYTVLYTDNSTHVNFSNYDIRSVDLSSYAGQSIHVAFHNHAWHLAPSATGLYIDNVEIRPAPVPVVSLSAPNPTNSHEPVTFTANLIEGSSTGLTYTWHSTLMDSTTVTTAPVLTMTYTAGGTDTMMVIASNAYGADTAIVIVTVHDCTARPVPYIEDFDGEEATTEWETAGSMPSCWIIKTSDASATTLPHIVSSYQYISAVTNNALLMMAGDPSQHGVCEMEMVAMPYINEPLTNLQLAFDYCFESSRCVLEVGYYNSYLDVFTVVDTVTPHTGSYIRDTVSFLGVTANNVHIALRWSHSTSYWGVAIDNIEVLDTPVPQISIESPSIAYVYDTVDFTAHLLHGDTTGLTYSWQSTMVDNGVAQMVATDSVLHVLYTVPGTDTIKLTTVNAYGSRIDWVYVQVSDCNRRAIPYFDDFESVPVGVVDDLYRPREPGHLPECWESRWTGHEYLSPRGYGLSYYLDGTCVDTKVLVLEAGTNNNSSTVTYVVLPGFEYDINELSVAFDYFLLRYLEPQYNGIFSVGYMVDTVFTPVRNLTFFQHLPFRRDTIRFHDVTIPNARIALRYQFTLFADNYAAIDNLEVFRDTTPVLPPVPDTVWRTVTLTCDSTMGVTGGGGVYPDSSMVTLSATALDGYEFTSWDDGDSSNPRLVMVVSDTSFVAIFNAVEDTTLIPVPDTVWRTVTLNCDSTMGVTDGGGVYPDSSMVTLSATALDGYEFTSWDDGDTNAVRTLLLVSDTTFTAYFAPDTMPVPPDTVWRTVTVHLLLDSGDTLFEADVVSVTGAGSYPDSTLVTLTAYYDNYYPYFWYWVTPANDTLYDNPYSFVVTSDTVINAIFGPMCVGIDGTESAAPDVAIHPNPATGDAYVSVGVPSTVTVVDLQGRTVLQPTHVASSLCLQQGTLPKGIYFVSVSNSVGAVVKKLVIQ